MIVSGEAILSAENSRKPMGGRGSALNPDVAAHSAPRDPLAGGKGACCPSPRTTPPLSAFGPWFGLLVFNSTFSANRLYRAIGVGSISQRARGQHRHVIKQ